MPTTKRSLNVTDLVEAIGAQNDLGAPTGRPSRVLSIKSRDDARAEMAVSVIDDDDPHTSWAPGARLPSLGVPIHVGQVEIDRAALLR